MFRRYLERVCSYPRLGFTKWGFVILRGVYGNDNEWKAFIELWKALAIAEMEAQSLMDEVGPTHAWTIIEDQERLQDASKDTVRNVFEEWVAARSVERDGEGILRGDNFRFLPRFRYCIYVDEACLKSVTAAHTAQQLSTESWRITGGEVAIIEREYTRPDPDQAAREYREMYEMYGDDDELTLEEYLAIGPEEFVSVEGNTAFNLGWTYISILEATAFYCSLAENSEHWDDQIRLRRPENPPEPNGFRNDVSLSSVPVEGPFGFPPMMSRGPAPKKDNFGPVDAADIVGLFGMEE